MGRREAEQRFLEKISRGFVEALAERGVSPMSITLAAFTLALASSAVYVAATRNTALYFLAGALLLLSGFLDAVDGAVARRLEKASDLGAFVDSVADKLGEAAVLIAITASGVVSPLWGSAALAFSIMVSYVRHRAEPLGVVLKGVGFMERAERMLVLAAATFIEPIIQGALQAAIIIVALLAALTVVHRIAYVVKVFNRKPS